MKRLGRGLVSLGFVALLVVSFVSLGYAKTVIRWTEWPRPNQEQLVEALITSFEAKHPDIKVEYQPMTSAQQVTVSMAGGAAPDVIGYWGDTLSSWMQQGAFLPLDDYLNAFGFDWDDFSPLQLQAFSYQGQQYILPHYLGTEVMFYNRDRFLAVGLPEPDETWTLATQRDVARKLTERGADGTTRWGQLLAVTSLDKVANLVSSFGGAHHPENDNGVVLWDQPEAVAALDFWREMIFDDETAPTVAQLQGRSYREMFAGSYAFMGTGLAIDLAHYAEVPFELGLSTMPSGPVTRASRATTDGFGVWAGTAHPEAAVKFLLHLVSPEANRLRAELQSLQPARKSVLSEWVAITVEAYPFVTPDEVMLFYHAGEYAEPIPVWSNPDLVGRTLRQAMNRIYADNEPAQRVMDEVIPPLNAALAAERR